jgi:hypothetical protein
MVVVAILAILSTGAIMGIGAINDSLEPARGGEIIRSKIEAAEEALARNEYEKISFNFEGGQNYIVAISEPESAEIDLDWDKESECLNTDFSEEVIMTITDRSKASLLEKIMAPGQKECFDFAERQEPELNYQLLGSNGEESPEVSFFRFNAEHTGYTVYLDEATGGQLIIDAQTGKRFYDSAGDQVENLTIKLETDSSETTVTLR